MLLCSACFGEDFFIDSPAWQLHNRIISHWKLEESSGTRVDSAPTNSLKTAKNDLNLNSGTPGNTTGIIGSAISVAATSLQTVSIASNTSLRIAASESMTICAWVYRTSNPATAARPVAKADSGGGGILEYALAYVASSTKMRFTVNDSTGLHQTSVDSTTVAALNTWYFTCGWLDNPNNLIWVQVNNDTPVSAAFSFDIFSGTGPFIIGGQNTVGAFYWTGRVDAVTLWRRLLTAEERTYAYNGGVGRQWPFVGVNALYNIFPIMNLFTQVSPASAPPLRLPLAG